jgi:16S rRNA (guanine(966)-N(2))-methyltransferase RsmD
LDCCVRIIAGEKRGTIIQAPKGLHTRPTLDRVRESLFGILQLDVPDAVVLDLFAGSGALGFEALSRGAKKAVLNDAARQAHAVVEANAKKLGFGDRAVLFCLDYTAAIRRAAAAGMRFDIVFLDPPYDDGLIPKAALALREAGALAEGFVIAAEHRSKDVPEMPEGFRLADRRGYGEAAISFFREGV